MSTALSEEASGLRLRLGLNGPDWIRAIPLYALLIGVFGVFLPWEKGQDFLNPVILGAYACLGIVFAAPAAAPEFQNRVTLQKALARVVVSVVYGELAAGVMLLLALTSVYVSHAGRIVVGPDLQSLADCVVMGLTLSTALSAGAVWLSVKYSPAVARSVVRLVFLGLLAAFYLRSGWLPTVALRAAAIGFLLTIVFFLGLRATLADGPA